MTESRLQRWARKKTETRRAPEPPAPPVLEPEPSPEEQELAINEALPEHEVLAKYNLPNPDKIELGTDITGFMRREIPEFLRRRALRSLWKSNPVLAVLDGLNDYDEDYTDAASAGSIVKTLYKVGQGFDRTPKVDEKAVEQVEEHVETPIVSAPAEKSESVAGISEETADEPEPEAGTGSLIAAGQGQPAATSSRAEPEPIPHYRPRMRFE